MRRCLAFLTVVMLVFLLTGAGWPSSSNAAIQSGDFTDYGKPNIDAWAVLALAASPDGLVYGVTDRRLFVFDPLTQAILDKGATPSVATLALAWGSDGKLYGGGWRGAIWSYDVGTGGFETRGQVPDGRRIIGLATGGDGRVYVGTEPGSNRTVLGRLYSLNTATGAIFDLGGFEESSSVGYGLLAGPDGKVYGGTLSGHLFVYDPSTAQLLDKGLAVATEYGVEDLVVGSDGLIYGSTQPNGHLFSYDSTKSLFADRGQAVSGQPRVVSLVSYGDKIYGGTGSFDDGSLHSAHFFEYDVPTHSFTDLGVPVTGERDITALATVGGTVYGGTAEEQARFFAYCRQPFWLSTTMQANPAATSRLQPPTFPLTAQVSL